MSSLSFRKKNKILKAFDYKCFYCHQDIDENSIHIDHLIPKSKGGVKYSDSNLVASCCKCNLFKCDLTPAEFLKKIQRKILEYKSELEYLQKINIFLGGKIG